jgi:nucleotide-binding universal stress UspA family protein
VHILTIARMWGTTFGFPNPGLLPSRSEMEAQRKSIARAVARLERRGIEAEGRVLATRAAGKRIVQEAARLRCDAIVMGADARRGALVGDFIWSQEPYRVRRRSHVPVYLVTGAD